MDNQNEKKNQPSIFKSNTYLNDIVYDYVY